MTNFKDKVCLRYGGGGRGRKVRVVSQSRRHRDKDFIRLERVETETISQYKDWKGRRNAKCFLWRLQSKHDVRTETTRLIADGTDPTETQWRGPAGRRRSVSSSWPLAATVTNASESARQRSADRLLFFFNSFLINRIFLLFARYYCCKYPNFPR